MTQDWKYPCQRSLITHLTPNRYIIIEFSFYDLLVSIASLNWIQNVYTKAYLVAIWRIVCACELIEWKWILCVSEWASESVDWWNNFFIVLYKWTTCIYIYRSNSIYLYVVILFAIIYGYVYPLFRFTSLPAAAVCAFLYFILFCICVYYLCLLLFEEFI